MNLPKDLYFLPFDQFSRQFIVASVVEKCLKGKSKSSLKIIDLGGHKGKTRLFHKDDEVTILDIFDKKYKGYVKGDATNTQFKEDAFDIACSFDVFEHIPRTKRKQFIVEALRISRKGVFIAAPINDMQSRVSAAENTLNEFYKELYGSDHQWLKEHIDYKIPDNDEVKGLIDEAGASFVSIPSNRLEDWILMQTLIFMTSKRPELGGHMQKLNQWFNKNSPLVDARSEAYYRQVFFISKDKQLIKLVDRYIANEKKKISSKSKLVFDQNMYQQVLKVIVANQSYIRKTEQENKRLKEELHQTYIHNRKLTDEITGIYQSKFWRVTRPLRVVSKIYKKRP